MRPRRPELTQASEDGLEAKREADEVACRQAGRGARASFRVAARLNRLRVRVGLLWLRREALRSVHGWAFVILLIVAAPSIWELLLGVDDPPLGSLGPTPRTGALIVSSLAMTLTYAVMFPAMFWRERFVRGEDDPLRAHPWLFPELLLVQVVSSAGLCAFHLVVFHDLMLHPLVTAGATRPGWTLLMHAGAAQAYFFTAGLLISLWLVAGRRQSGAALPSRQSQRLYALLFVATFPLFIVLPHVLSKAVPTALVAVGTIGPGALHLLQAPVAIVQAMAEGSWLRLAAWAGALFAAIAFLVRLLRIRTIHAALRGCETRSLGGSESYETAFPISTQGPVSRFRIFWTKDLILPLRRDLWAHMVPHSVLLSGALVGIAALGVGERFVLGGGVPAQIAVLVLVFALAAAVAGMLSLPSLGSEGRTIHLLRPFLSPAETLRIKLLVAGSYVIVVAPLYGLLIAAGALLIGLPAPSLISAMVIAAVGGSLMLLPGIALGFLLPDHRRQNSVLPGASKTGIAVFGLGTSGLCGLLAIARVLLARGEISPLVHAALLAAGALSVACISTLAVALALTRSAEWAR